jgi:hypothetical protein
LDLQLQASAANILAYKPSFMSPPQYTLFCVLAWKLLKVMNPIPLSRQTGCHWR